MQGALLLTILNIGGLETVCLSGHFKSSKVAPLVFADKAVQHFTVLGTSGLNLQFSKLAASGGTRHPLSHIHDRRAGMNFAIGSRHHITG